MFAIAYISNCTLSTNIVLSARHEMSYIKFTFIDITGKIIVISLKNMYFGKKFVSRSYSND